MGVQKPSQKPQPTLLKKPKAGVSKSFSESEAPVKPASKRGMGDGAVYRVMQRSQLKNADYNPRTIDPISAKRLGQSIDNTGGLVQPPIYNERTGNIVGGHRRLERMDIKKGNTDYSLTVACVDWPLEKEIEVNIALNNQASQGQFDIGMLDDLLGREGVDIGNTGFDVTTLELLHMDHHVDLPDWMLPNEEVDSAEIIEGITDDIEAAAEEAGDSEIDNEEQEGIALIKERKKEFADRQNFLRHGKTTLRVMFPTDGTKKILMDHLGLDNDAEYVDGMAILEALDLGEEAKEVIESEKPKKMKEVESNKRKKRKEDYDE